jgi:hypothetical protein
MDDSLDMKLVILGCKALEEGHLGLLDHFLHG